jgi:transcription initiation factor TFIIB
MSTNEPSQTDQTNSDQTNRFDRAHSTGHSAPRNVTHAQPLGGRMPEHPRQCEESFNRPDPEDSLRFRDSQYGRAKRLHHRSKWLRGRGQEKSLREGLSEIKRLASCLGLTRGGREQAAHIFHSAAAEDGLANEEGFPGHDLDAVAAGTIYIAAFISGTPRSVAEVAEVAYCDAQHIRKERRDILGSLNIPQFSPAPVDLIRRHSETLAENMEWDDDRLPSVALTRTAERLLDRGQSIDAFRSRSRRTQAGAALYVAAQRLGFGLTQQGIADALDVSTTTLRKAYHDLEEVGGDVDA